jgi:hypothetical protein
VSALDDQEDGPPMVPPPSAPEVDTLPPPPGVPDTDHAVDPVLAGLQEGVKQILTLVQNLAIEVNSVKTISQNAVDVARSARSAAEVSSDTSSAIVKMLNEKVMTALADLDRKFDENLTPLAGNVSALAGEVAGQKHTLWEHQERLDEHAAELGIESERHAANGNGSAE